MQAWYPHNDEYVGEQLRREGRGDTWAHSRCAGVRCYDPERRCPNRVCVEVPEYRCADEACVGEAMYCARCIVAAHAQLPTHFIERWTGTHFERKRTGLKDLGLRVQLNHPPGVVCAFRRAGPGDFVLYDLTGVHEIAMDYCGCRPADGTPEGGEPMEERTQLLRSCWWPATLENPKTCATFGVLRLFHVLNCLGKLSAYDFLRGLEKCTNHDGLNRPPDRRKPFMLIMRQWREVKRMKRFKRGHDASGVRATGQGELALKCRACPQPGWNLPDNWDQIDPFYRFIYWLFLAEDANFRLSNRNVSSEALDPILGDGFGYFCKREGADGYKAHIEKHASEQEVSNCSGFQAMFMANTRRVKGLRTTGIGGVTCSRHNMWQGNGIGDLQVGERYCNMDFLLVSVLINFCLLCAVVSYDIACQFGNHFWERQSKFPAERRLTFPESYILWKVPNFHLAAHKPVCHAPFSFHFMWGAGMTHGEGVEQNWAFSNGAAASTRLMGPGSRQATLEDVFGFHNYDRVLAMHRVLPKRLAVSIKEGTKHKAAFDAFSKGLEEVRPEEVKQWKEEVLRWEMNPHPQSSQSKSPFESVQEVTLLRDIQLEIAKEEFMCTEDGVEVEREHSPGGFVTMGLQVEEVQRKLEVDVRSLKDPTAAQTLAFTKRRTALLKRIHRFRQVQGVYMPALRALLLDEQRQVYDGNGEQLPEATRLFMPSELNETIRGKACATGLPEIEARMREGEAMQALEAVRHGLRTRTMTNRYKLRNWTGQGMMTKGQGILRQINIKIHAAKLRYRYARAALLALRNHGAWEERLRILDDDDVRALNERALTDEEKAQNKHWAELGGAIVEGGVARAAALAAGEGSHTLSWIWYSAGNPSDENDSKLQEALRLEWCKAYARAKRFSEDVRLLREEMRRTITYGYTAAAGWEELARAELPGSEPMLTEGRRAYAAEHAATERATCALLEKNWAGILAKADVYLEGTAALDAEAIVTIEMDLGDELDPEEEEARLEGEEEEE
ncbi:hypothetical protein DFH08DRAFT_725398 [Mycena albidolilacea]|uniref:CxC2-like cysteine cluster KDZ transposase-associated domain-containing protein n=1 Tax=Mycena albidolilacea TaxID=1033008 RepID=A0AAD6YWG7_9AGAR|nr:hypothetical protein DFH08DRAFT_725398 [Mycena albidolilacea]